MPAGTTSGAACKARTSAGNESNVTEARILDQPKKDNCLGHVRDKTRNTALRQTTRAYYLTVYGYTLKCMFIARSEAA